MIRSAGKVFISRQGDLYDLIKHLDTCKANSALKIFLSFIAKLYQINEYGIDRKRLLRYATQNHTYDFKLFSSSQFFGIR